MPVVSQSSFASGELSPKLYGRVDIAKYKSGAALLENFFVDYRGGVSTRAGTKFVARAKYSNLTTRIIEFQFNAEQTYALEFGNQYMRVHQNGSPVLEPAVNITAATQANPCEITAPGHGYSDGDWVYFASVVGMTELNQKTYIVTNAGANTFELTDYSGNNIDSSNFTAYVGGGEVSRVYTMATPYVSDDLFLLKFVQSADVITITHPDYSPRDLSRTQHYAWTLTEINFASTIDPPATVSASASTSGAAAYSYIVTAFSRDTGEESIGSNPGTVGSAVNIAATAGTITISWDAVTDAEYYNIYKAPISISSDVAAGTLHGYISRSYGMEFKDSNITPDYTKSPPIHRDPFAIGAIESLSITAGGSGHTSTPTITITDPTGSGAVIQAVVVGGAVENYIIINAGSNYSNPSVNISGGGGSGATATATVGPTTGTYPSVPSYFQQRKVFGATYNNPQTMWMTKPGAFTNMDISNPTVADDALQLTLVSRQVNEIKALVAMPNGLLVFTAGTAWQVNGGDQRSALTATSALAQQQSYNGCADVPPIPIGYEILYVQAKGSTVRNLSYNFVNNNYVGADLSVMSNHLFTGYEIVDWAWAEEPFKVVHTVRSDGTMLTLTFLKDQEIAGWAHSNTYGLFRSVCSIREGNEDVIYAVVDRYLNGEWMKFIERQQTRHIAYGLAENSWCLDCALELVPEYPDANLTISGITGSVTITATTAIFTSDNEGDVIRAGGGIIDVTEYVAADQVRGTVRSDILAVIYNAGTGNSIPAPINSGEWNIATPVDQITGLEHLEGETVGVVGDGSVMDDAVVSNGAITLSHNVSKLVVGLKYRCRFQTLPLDVGDPTIQGKRKKIPALTMILNETRGVSAGPNFDDLIELKQWNADVELGQPMPLVSAEERMLIESNWDVEGQLCIEQNYPMPATILSVVPEIVIGDQIR